MRIVKIIMFVVDAEDPSVSLDSILEDGAEENGYTAVPYNTDVSVDNYWKFKKE